MASVHFCFYIIANLLQAIRNQVVNSKYILFVTSIVQSAATICSIVQFAGGYRDLQNEIHRFQLCIKRNVCGT